jgi:23S rRNA pseudouridine955/2504/2580 synthase
MNPSVKVSLSMPPVRHVCVAPEHDGRKLFSFLRSQLGALPETLLLRLVRTGQIRVDGKRVEPYVRVFQGQIVRIPPIHGAPRLQIPQPGPVDIVHTTADVLVVDKPAGLPVHPGSGWQDALSVRLAAVFPEFPPVPVHRLDRDTSGLVVCARNHQTLRELHGVWSQVRKGYLCWVQGAWSLGHGMLEDLLAKHGPAGREKVVPGAGKRATAWVTPLAVGPVSLLGVVLGSGRTHQIRVQLASRGYPIVGDGKYGQPGARLLLHATCLATPKWQVTCLPQWPMPFALTSLEKDISQWIEHILTSYAGSSLR